MVDKGCIILSMFEHSCIKCGDKYQDNEADDYYCPPHDAERKQIAKEIDTKLSKRPPKRKIMSGLDEYDAAPKVHGFMQVKL